MWVGGGGGGPSLGVVVGVLRVCVQRLCGWIKLIPALVKRGGGLEAIGLDAQSLSGRVPKVWGGEADPAGATDVWGEKFGEGCPLGAQVGCRTLCISYHVNDPSYCRGGREWGQPVPTVVGCVEGEVYAG